MKKLNLKTLALLGLSGGLLLGAGSTQNTANTSAQANAKAHTQSQTAGGNTKKNEASKADTSKEEAKDSSNTGESDNANKKIDGSKDKDADGGSQNIDWNDCSPTPDVKSEGKKAK